MFTEQKVYNFSMLYCIIAGNRRKLKFFIIQNASSKTLSAARQTEIQIRIFPNFTGMLPLTIITLFNYFLLNLFVHENEIEF